MIDNALFFEEILETLKSNKELMRLTNGNITANRVSDIVSEVLFRDGEPCKHTGCLNHISHPCEGCGRIAGEGFVYKNVDWSNGEDMTCEVTAIKLPNGEINVLDVKYK